VLPAVTDVGAMLPPCFSVCIMRLAMICARTAAMECGGLARFRVHTWFEIS
jgi:hypothetical protein